MWEFAALSYGTVIEYLWVLDCWFWQNKWIEDVSLIYGELQQASGIFLLLYIDCFC